MKRLNLEELRELFPIAYAFVVSHDLLNIQEQRYELGKGAYVNVESYGTYRYEDRKYESHILYSDIQYIITGKEAIFVEPIKHLRLSDAYDSNKDIAFYNNDIKGKEVDMKAGNMLLLNPEDGHMPCIAVGESSYVKKAVFKIPLNGVR